VVAKHRESFHLHLLSSRLALIREHKISDLPPHQEPKYDAVGCLRSSSSAKRRPEAQQQHGWQHRVRHRNDASPRSTLHENCEAGIETDTPTFPCCKAEIVDQPYAAANGRVEPWLRNMMASNEELFEGDDREKTEWNTPLQWLYATAFLPHWRRAGGHAVASCTASPATPASCQMHASHWSTSLPPETRA